MPPHILGIISLIVLAIAGGAKVQFVRADVCDEDDVKKLVDKTVARFGRLDGRRQ
jgi:NAD(P)-dependent dehydrogenase (short-subunit alcohol dehydrogenase family)